MLKSRLLFRSNEFYKIYTFNLKEREFLYALEKKSSKLEKSWTIVRSSNGAIDMYYHYYYIGRIKIRNGRNWMRFLVTFFEYKYIEGNIDEFISNIDNLLIYIEKVLKEK